MDVSMDAVSDRAGVWGRVPFPSSVDGTHPRGSCPRGSARGSGWGHPLNPPSARRHGLSLCRAYACAAIFLIGCSAAGARAPGATITRVDDTTIDQTTLTKRIEALTRVAHVHGLTV